MARFCSLYSGSSGNSTYIGTSKSGLLVDAGVTAKAIKTALSEREIDINSLEGILITHEHIDHVRGLKVLLKSLLKPIFASKETLGYIVDNDMVPAGASLVEIENGKPFTLGDMEITGFQIPHDCCGGLGYRITTPDEHKIAVATDLGHVSDEVRAGITGCDFVMLEANYDERMLDCSAYPYYLKRRIKSDIGHLSNTFCANEISSLIKCGGTRFVLAHLSKENNYPQLAYETIMSTLVAEGYVHNRDFTLEVAPRSTAGEMYKF